MQQRLHEVYCQRQGLQDLSHGLITAAPDAETPADEEAPKPRRRRAAAAKPDATSEAPAEEETPKPRTRRRRTTASAADESAPETEVTETPESPEEEA